MRSNLNQRVILFSRPIYLVCDGEINNGIRPVDEIYGFIVGTNLNYYNIDLYISYMCGCSKWYQEGNSMSKNHMFVSKDGKYYSEEHPYIKNFIKKAREEMKVKWYVIETNKTLDEDTEGVSEGKYIISQSLYSNLMEYGKKVDVQMWLHKNDEGVAKTTRKSKNRHKSGI